VSGPAVLDASALLALLADEPGASVVAPLLDGAVMSTVNWAEVLQRYAAEGLTLEGRRAQIEALGLSLVPFSAEHAAAAASLFPATRLAGLSLADRACLALAATLDAPAYTADRAWVDVDAGVVVELVR